MGAYGHKDPVTGKEIVIQTVRNTRYDKPPAFRLRPCPICGAEQIHKMYVNSPVYVMYVGAGDAGKWVAACKECGFAIEAKTPEEAAEEWNFEPNF